MIEVERLTKSYGPVAAVQDVSFRIAEGEIVGFLGPNGAGKTTIMRMLTGFLPPTEGKVRIDGFDMFEASMEARRRIGYLPETPPVYPEMTVDEYLRFVAELKGVSRTVRAGRVDAVIGRLHLGEMRRRLIGNLSKGFRQRVGLAQALVHEPRVLVLDEPTVGLDPVQIVEIRNLIAGLAAQHTVILSTHILPEVSAICRRIIIINGGRIVGEGSQENLMARSGGSRRVSVSVKAGEKEGDRAAMEKALAAACPGADVKPAGGDAGAHRFSIGVPAGMDVREAVFKAVVAGGWVLLEMTPEAGGLEEVFMKLTREEGLAPAPAPREPSHDNGVAA